MFCVFCEQHTPTSAADGLCPACFVKFERADKQTLIELLTAERIEKLRLLSETNESLQRLADTLDELGAM